MGYGQGISDEERATWLQPVAVTSRRATYLVALNELVHQFQVGRGIDEAFFVAWRRLLVLGLVVAGLQLLQAQQLLVQVGQLQARALELAEDFALELFVLV